MIKSSEFILVVLAFIVEVVWRDERSGKSGLLHRENPELVSSCVHFCQSQARINLEGISRPKDCD